MKDPTGPYIGEPHVSCAVLHTDGAGNSIPCPDGQVAWDPNPAITAKLFAAPKPVIDWRTPPRLYEVRTIHGEIYCAPAGVVEQNADWLTLLSGSEISLRIPTSDLRALRQMDPEELAAPANDAEESPLDEARSGAWYGYEIGQRHTPLSQVLAMPDEPQNLTPGRPFSSDFLTGYRHAVAAVKCIASDATTPSAITPDACCVCGSGFVTYYNYKGMPFCRPCAGCDCAQDPCVRTRGSGTADGEADHG